MHDFHKDVVYIVFVQMIAFKTAGSNPFINIKVFNADILVGYLLLHSLVLMFFSFLPFDLSLCLFLPRIAHLTLVLMLTLQIVCLF